MITGFSFYFVSDEFTLGSIGLQIFLELGFYAFVRGQNDGWEHKGNKGTDL